MIRITRPRRVLAALALTGLAAAAAAPTTAHANVTGRYVAGGTVVVRAQGETPVDDGLVVCDSGDGVGTGGFCLPFGGGDAVSVTDAVNGENVAFQVCVDNNGDGFCASEDPDPQCPDDVYFSHDDAGQFHNPVGPVRTGFRPGCAGGAWQGYVVMLCQGVHVTTDAHSHPATSGTGVVTTGGEGVGNFCQSPRGKAYVVTGGNHTCGLSGSEDASPEAPDSTFFASLAGGPWRAAGATSYELRCSVQVDGVLAASLAATGGPNGVVLQPAGVVFLAPPGSVVEVCTRVAWTGAASGTYVGCQTAVEVNNGDYRAFVAPQRPE